MSTLSLAPLRPPFRIDEKGSVRIGVSRVSLYTIIANFKDGSSAEEIAVNFPTVALGDVYATIAYYLANTAEVEAYMQRYDADAAEIRRKVEALCGDQAEIRERLLARHAAKKLAQ